MKLSEIWRMLRSANMYLKYSLPEDFAVTLTTFGIPINAIDLRLLLRDKSAAKNGLKMKIQIIKLSEIWRMLRPWWGGGGGTPL